MNKNILLLLPICLIISACESLARDQPPPKLAALAPLSDIIDCPGDGKKTITIITNKNEFSIKPPHLCIEAEDVIVVNFTGNNDAGTIVLKAKPFIDADWLSATNPGTNPDKATIIVPAETDPALYLYDVVAAGFGTIDPMITVKE